MFSPDRSGTERRGRAQGQLPSLYGKDVGERWAGRSSAVYLALYARKTLLLGAKHLVTWTPRKTGGLALTERRLGRVPLCHRRILRFNSLSQSPQMLSREAPIAAPLRLKWRSGLSLASRHFRCAHIFQSVSYASQAELQI
jgi:hypothetical protein